MKSLKSLAILICSIAFTSIVICNSDKNTNCKIKLIKFSN